MTRDNGPKSATIHFLDPTLHAEPREVRPAYSESWIPIVVSMGVVTIGVGLFMLSLGTYRAADEPDLESLASPPASVSAIPAPLPNGVYRWREKRLARFDRQLAQQQAARRHNAVRVEQAQAISRQRCSYIEDELEQIRARRRLGFTPQEGEWLRDRRRLLEDEYKSLQCLRLRDRA